MAKYTSKVDTLRITPELKIKLDFIMEISGAKESLVRRKALELGLFVIGKLLQSGDCTIEEMSAEKISDLFKEKKDIDRK